MRAARGGDRQSVTNKKFFLREEFLLLSEQLFSLLCRFTLLSLSCFMIEC
jgi:hypothetical protein